MSDKKWLSVSDYFGRINADSRKYFEINENILEIIAEMLPLDFCGIFNNTNEKLKFEIGFGNCDSLIKLAAANPDTNYFGIDRKMDRIRISLKKLNKSPKMKNLVIARSGTEYLSKMILPGTFDEIIMNFPDPWPKKKHHKNRTVNEEFLKVIYELLKTDGVFRFSSDHEGYTMEVLDIITGSGLFTNSYGTSYRDSVVNRIETQFERHKKREGFKIFYLKFNKV